MVRCSRNLIASSSGLEPRLDDARMKNIRKGKYITNGVPNGMPFFLLYGKGGREVAGKRYRYRVVEVRKGNRKTDGKPFHVMELHCPETYRNGLFNVDLELDTSKLRPGDEVECDFDVTLNQWNHRITIVGISKVTA